ncbi:MAG TPA: hypothetical protein VNI77_03675 [Nitrososphaera sp.]|nr:hypothetical protein [Nitrososphaera sp.]
MDYTVTVLEVFSFRCPTCGYNSKHPLGTPDMDQTLTDVNTEFAQYRLFVCRQEKKFVHMDTLDSHFDNKCPADKSELEQVSDPKKALCPACGKELEVADIKPLATADSAAE